MTSLNQKLRERFKGANAIGAKLNDYEVAKMRLRFLKGEKRLSIAKDYPDVHPTTVYEAVRYKTWVHIPNTIEELEDFINGRKEN